MALKSCRECGKQVSEAAKTCPQCGIEKPFISGAEKLGSALVAWFWIIVIGLLIYIGTK